MDHPAVIPIQDYKTSCLSRLDQIKDDTNFCRQDSERFPISYCIIPTTVESQTHARQTTRHATTSEGRQRFVSYFTTILVHDETILSSFVGVGLKDLRDLGLLHHSVVKSSK